MCVYREGGISQIKVPVTVSICMRSLCVWPIIGIVGVEPLNGVKNE